MEALAFLAKLKSGDDGAWSELIDLARAARDGETESRQALTHILNTACDYQIPCCESCARGLPCEGARAPLAGGCSCANRPLVGGCGCANRPPMVGFCAPCAAIGAML